MEFIILSDILWGSLIVFLGALLQSSSGIGFALIVTPCFLLLSPDYVPVPSLILACFLSILNLFRFKHSLDFKKVNFILLGRLPGSVLAVIILGFFNFIILNIFIGAALIVSTLLTILRWQVQPNFRNLFLGGFFGGIIGTISGMGGPAVAIVLQNCPKKIFLGTISFYFILGNIISLIILSIADIANITHFILSLLWIPSAIVGFVLASFIVTRINAENFKRIIQVICLLAGVSLVIKSIFF